MSELLSRGAVQEEVQRVIGVHEQFGDGPGKSEIGMHPDVIFVLVPERRGDADNCHRQSRDQERKRYSQKHDR